MRKLFKIPLFTVSSMFGLLVLWASLYLINPHEGGAEEHMDEINSIPQVVDFYKMYEGRDIRFVSKGYNIASYAFVIQDEGMLVNLRLGYFAGQLVNIKHTCGVFEGEKLFLENEITQNCFEQD